MILSPSLVLFLGRVNTEGDAVVWLPKERIVFAGDIVVQPLPYGFGSSPTEWLDTLERAREQLDLGPLAARFTGGDARRQQLFDAWFVQPFASSAYKEATGQPIVQGARE